MVTRPPVGISFGYPCQRLGLRFTTPFPVDFWFFKPIFYEGAICKNVILFFPYANHGLTSIRILFFFYHQRVSEVRRSFSNRYHPFSLYFWFINFYLTLYPTSRRSSNYCHFVKKESPLCAYILQRAKPLLSRRWSKFPIRWKTFSC